MKSIGKMLNGSICLLPTSSTVGEGLSFCLTTTSFWLELEVDSVDDDGLRGTFRYVPSVLLPRFDLKAAMVSLRLCADASAACLLTIFFNSSGSVLSANSNVLWLCSPASCCAFRGRLGASSTMTVFMIARALESVARCPVAAPRRPSKPADEFLGRANQEKATCLGMGIPITSARRRLVIHRQESASLARAIGMPWIRSRRADRCTCVLFPPRCGLARRV